MNSNRFDDALTDVAKVFSCPAEIVSATDLSKSQKLELLKQWEYELRSRLIASEANMPVGAPGEKTRPPLEHAVGLLREVRAALSAVGVADSPQGINNKAGSRKSC